MSEVQDAAGNPSPDLFGEPGYGTGYGTPSEPIEAPTPKPPRTPTAALAWTAFGLSVLLVIADVMAVMLAVDRYWESATLIAQAANLGTVIAFILGLFAAWRTPGRWLGISAMVVAVLANPFILTHLLAFLGG